jgi:hypothetical protein
VAVKLDRGVKMSEIIKKVAEAICERRNANDWPCNGLDFDEEMAKVAISAMLEPNMPQVEAGLVALVDEIERVSPDCSPSELVRTGGEIKAVWHAMIKSALKDE